MGELVLVTGAAGFLGLSLAARLRREGRAVRALVRPTSDRAAQQRRRRLAALGVELAEGDVLDPPSVDRALDGVSTAFHLAGRLLTAGTPEAVYRELHVAGTRHLLGACARRRIRRVVHCSTTGVLGPTGAEPIDEEAPPRPGDAYERTKAEAEQLARAAAAAGLPVRIVRPSLVYGPGDAHLLAWFRAIDRGGYCVVGRGDALLHPVYVDDVAAGMVQAAAEGPPGRVFHLVGPEPVPVCAIARAIAAALGRSLPRWRLPRWVALAAAAGLEWLPGLDRARLPLTRSRVAFMTRHRAYSGARARAELGFVPAIGLDEGMRRTVAWYRAEGWL